MDGKKREKIYTDSQRMDISKNPLLVHAGTMKPVQKELPCVCFLEKFEVKFFEWMKITTNSIRL